MSSATAIAAASARLWPALGSVLVLILALAVPNAAIPSAALAQSGSLFSATPSTGLLSPGQGTRGNGFGPGGVLAPPSQAPLIMPNSATPTAPMPMVPAGQVALALSARFGKQAPVIGGGLTWRVYAAKAEPGGSFKLLKEEKSP